MSGIQFWDASALIPLIFQEIHTPSALRAYEQGEKQLAWGWVAIETHATLYRRKAQPKHFGLLQTLLENIDYMHLAPDAGDHPALVKLLEKHRLRSADAGHLFCLKRAGILFPDLEFVCFDDELCRAAKKESIRIFEKENK